MTENAVVDVPLNDDQLIAFAQSKRKQLVEKITEKGIPEDNDSQNTMLRALEGMSSTALGNKRIKTDVDANQEVGRARAIITQLLDMAGNKNPFEVVSPDGVPVGKIPTPDTLIGDVDIKPGETEIGVSSDSFNTFADANDIKR